MLLCRISHLSPLPPLNKSVFGAHNLAQCQLSAAHLYNAPNEDDVGTEGVLGVIFVLPAVRSLCQRHSQGGIWIDLKCKKQDKRIMLTFLMWKKMSYPPHFQLLVLYSALGTLFSSAILAKRTELSSVFPNYIWKAPWVSSESEIKLSSEVCWSLLT